uniref:Uncharacterized protein n=2 Tax=Paracidobacterium acidisoli TaxID=2303751 RepID=A0A372IU69_9BACT
MLISVPGAMAQRGAGGSGSHGGGGGHAVGGGFAGHPAGGGFAGRPLNSGGFSTAPRAFLPPGSFSRSFSGSFPVNRSASSWGQPGLTSQRLNAFTTPYFGRSRPASGAAWSRTANGFHNGNGYGDGHARGDHRYRYRSPYRGYGYGGAVGLVPWEVGYPDFMGYGDQEYDDSGSASAEAAPDQNGSAEAPEGYSNQPYEESDARQDYAPPPEYAPQERLSQTSQPAPIAEPTLTVVFRDGHTQEIRNYALTPTTLIVLDEAAAGRQQRISLDQVDLQATEQSARQAGLEFRPPSA